MRTYRKTKPEHGKLHWGCRIQIYEPIVSGDLSTTWFQVPYTGQPDKNLIQRALRKTAPREYFGKVFEPEVVKIDQVEGVVIVKLTQSMMEA